MAHRYLCVEGTNPSEQLKVNVQWGWYTSSAQRRVASKIGEFIKQMTSQKNHLFFDDAYTQEISF